MPNKLLLYGKGGHSSVVREACGKTWEAIEQIDQNDDTDLFYKRFPPAQWVAHVAIGNNEHRNKVSTLVLSCGYELATIIHPAAYVAASATIGPGCYIGPMACVQVRCNLGTGVIVNTSASIDHDCVIGDFVHVAPGTHLCGSIVVGEGTLLGAGSIIVPDVHIGSRCILGTGSALIETFEGDNLKMWGVPAKVVIE